MKICNTCDKEKTLDHFPKSGKWVRKRCKECQAKRSREIYEPRRCERRVRIHPFGYLNRKAYEQLIPGSCQICGKDCHVNDRLILDHEHSTNLARGFLCHHCNLIIGHAYDNPEILRAAVQYLENAKEDDYMLTLTNRIKACKAT